MGLKKRIKPKPPKLIRIELHSKQKKFVYSRAEITAMLGGRGVGKSVGCGFVAGVKMTRGLNGLIMAPTYRDLKAVVVKNIINVLESFGYKKGIDYIYHETDKQIILYDKKGNVKSTVYCRSTDDPDCTRGLSDISWLIIDEAALCPKEAYDVALATLRGKDVDFTQVYLISTPRGRGNWVSEVFSDPKTNAITATTFDNPHLRENFTGKLKDRYDDVFYRQEVLGEIIDVTATCVFSPDDITRLFSQPVWVKGEIVAGLDVGRTGDLSALSIRNGNRIVYLKGKRTLETQTFIDWIIEARKIHPFTKIFIDQTGLGGFLPKDLEKIFPELEIVPVQFSGEASEGYRNKRTEIYYDLKAWIKDGLHFSPDLDPSYISDIKTQLCATDYFIDNRSDFALISKDDIKKKITGSPDEADALALCCSKGSRVTAQEKQQTLKYLQLNTKKFKNLKG